MTNQANEHSPNLIASVQQRLRNIAQQRRTDYRLILERYAGERLLYRVSQSPYRDQLILKGATLLYLWTKQEFRATRDVDFLGFGSTDLEAIRQMMTEICRVEYAEDGLRFQGGTIGVEDILDEQEYGGVRAKLKAYLGTTRIHLQVDIGFGDVVTPNPIEQEYPTLLGHPAPKLKTYPRETFIAEKFEAMVRLGPTNSRMKDFWDVAALALQFSFDGPTLQSAIKRTFERRDTPLTQEVPDALRTTFYQNQDKSNQWQAFLTRTQPQLAVPPTFNAVGELVRSFLNPIRESILDDRPFTQEWLAGGSWQSKGVSKTGGVRNTKTEVKAKELEASLKTPPRRFKPYPAYKDSKVEWMGEIPSHWQAKRLKYVAPVSDERSYQSMSDVPYVGLEHIESGTGKLAPVVESEAVESTTSVFRPGDVLFGKLRPYLAKVFRPDFEGRCSTELLVLRSDGNIDSSNLAYQLLSPGFIRWIDSMTYGTKMPRANPEQIANTGVALPTSSEQRAISAFLDRETEKIDALIQKNERLIELLKQKRTALITHAVTKGLDPNVPMKDSGIEWLGEIPAHWEVKKNKLLFKETDSRSLAGEEELLTVSHITGVTRRSEKQVYMFEPESHEGYKLCNKNDLIINTMWAWMGALGIALEDGMVSPSYNVYRFQTLEVLPRFYDYLCRIPAHVSELTRFSKGVWKSRLRLYPEEFFQIFTPFPKLKEQEAIVEILDHETNKLETLIQKIHEGTAQLKEFRTALISAAATGKIDVRESLNNSDELNIHAMVN